MTEGRSALIDGLSPSQHAVATSTESNLVGVAAPGAGKTHTLIGRVVWLCQRYGLRPDQFLLLTFTNAAVEHLRLRFNEPVENRTASQPDVLTFHALGMKILRTWWAAKDAKMLSAADERESRTILDGIFKGSRRVRSLQAFGVTRARMTIRNYGAGLKVTTRLNEKEPDLPELQAEALWRTWLVRHFEKGMIPYDGIIPQAIAALDDAKNCPELQRRIEHWKHVFVDEAHDQTPGEVLFLRMLTALAGASMFQVMDPRQSIFGFRGAHLDAWDLVQGQGVTVMPLAESWRITPSMAKLANLTATRMASPPWVEPVVSRKPDPKRSVAIAIPCGEHGSLEVLPHAVLSLRQRYADRDIALLCRTNYDCELLANAVPGSMTYQQARARSRSQGHDELEAVMAAARLCLNENDDAAFYRLLAAEVFRHAPNGDWEESVPWLGAYTAFSRGVPMDNLPLPLRAIAAYRSGTPLSVDDLAASIYCSPASCARVQIYLSTAGMGGLDVEDAVAHWMENSGEDEAFHYIRSRGCIAVSTVHAARGREWPAVVAMTTETWPCAPARGELAAEEEWRLLFVAITRSSEALVLTSGNEHVEQLLKEYGKS